MVKTPAAVCSHDVAHTISSAMPRQVYVFNDPPPPSVQVYGTWIRANKRVSESNEHFRVDDVGLCTAAQGSDRTASLLLRLNHGLVNLQDETVPESRSG